MSTSLKFEQLVIRIYENLLYMKICLLTAILYFECLYTIIAEVTLSEPVVQQFSYTHSPQFGFNSKKYTPA